MKEPTVLSKSEQIYLLLPKSTRWQAGRDNFRITSFNIFLKSTTNVRPLRKSGGGGDFRQSDGQIQNEEKVRRRGKEGRKEGRKEGTEDETQWMDRPRPASRATADSRSLGLIRPSGGRGGRGRF